MADINSRKFRWLADEDSESTHLVLRPGEEYPVGNVSASVLIKWEKEGKIEFVEDPIGIELPAATVLKVQDGSIDLSSLIVQIKAGIKER